MLLLAALFFYIASYLVVPRFIIAVREQYDQNLHRRWQGIDTGFGVLSQPTIASQNAALSAIVFADVALEQDQVEEGEANESEAIRLETLDSNARRV